MAGTTPSVTSHQKSRCGGPRSSSSSHLRSRAARSLGSSGGSNVTSRWSPASPPTWARRSDRRRRLAHQTSSSCWPTISASTRCPPTARPHRDSEHRSDRRRRCGLRRGLRHVAHLRACARGHHDRPCPEPLRLRDPGHGALSDQLGRVHLRPMDRRHRRVRRQGQAIVPADWQAHKQGVPPSEITLAEILKKYGYAPGSSASGTSAFHREQVPLEPVDSTTSSASTARSLSTRPSATGPASSTTSTIVQRAAPVEHGPRRRSGHPARTARSIDEEQYLTFAFRDEMKKYIEEHKDEPFFIYARLHRAARALPSARRLLLQYAHVEDDNKRVYYSMISALDDAIGEVHQNDQGRRHRREHAHLSSERQRRRLLHPRDGQRAPQRRQAHPVRGRHQRALHDEVEGQRARRHALPVPRVLDRHLRDLRRCRRWRRCRVTESTTGSISFPTSRARTKARPTSALLACRPHLGDSRRQVQAHLEHAGRLGRAVRPRQSTSPSRSI